MSGVEIDIFVTGAHASIRKAASMAGLGRGNVVDLSLPHCHASSSAFPIGQNEKEREEDGGKNNNHPCAFNLPLLRSRLEANSDPKEGRKRRGSIVVVSFGEVNTGGITPLLGDLRALRREFGFWLHFDAGLSSLLDFLFLSFCFFLFLVSFARLYTNCGVRAESFLCPFFLTRHSSKKKATSVAIIELNPIRKIWTTNERFR